jgi:hypothetical protein
MCECLLPFAMLLTHALTHTHTHTHTLCHSQSASRSFEILLIDGLNESRVLQTLLENAMRSVDKTLEDRWDRIADLIPNRSRKEVVSRVKDVKKMLASSLAS